MANGFEERNKSIVEVYTKHIEISTSTLQAIRNLTLDLKKYDENFKCIDGNFCKLIEELEFLKIYLERALKVHHEVTTSQTDNLLSGSNSLRDEIKKYVISFEKAVSSVKSRISFVYLGFVAIIIALLGLLFKKLC